MKKKVLKLKAKLGSLEAANKRIAENKKIRKPFYYAIIFVLVLGLTLSALTYYNYI